MTEDTADDDESGYTYEPSVAERGIRSLVRKAAQRGYRNPDIRSAVREMLADERVAEPTAEQLDHPRAAREMASEFGDRLNRASKRLENAERNDGTGVEIEFTDGAGEDPEIKNDGRPIEQILPDDADAEVAAVARKIEYGYRGETVESEYPLVMVGQYPVCTCPDRHFNRRQGGTCYHEIAHDFRAGQREDDEAREKAVVHL